MGQGIALEIGAPAQQIIQQEGEGTLRGLEYQLLHAPAAQDLQSVEVAGERGLRFRCDDGVHRAALLCVDGHILAILVTYPVESCAAGLSSRLFGFGLFRRIFLGLFFWLLLRDDQLTDL